MFPFNRKIIFIEKNTPHVTHQENEDGQDEEGAYNLE
jgi:hypothetical protein